MTDQIYETLKDVPLNRFDDIYIRRPTPFMLHEYRDQINIVDLTNAGQKGKKCKTYTVQVPFQSNTCTFWNWYNRRFEDTDKLIDNLNSLPFVPGAYSQAEFRTEELINIFRDEAKAYSTVSPFKLEADSLKPSKHLLMTVSGHAVVLDTNKQITIDGQVFKLGDECKQGSYNLIYTGTITAIHEKTIESNGCPKGQMRDSIKEFVDRNAGLDLEEIASHNADWSD